MASPMQCLYTTQGDYICKRNGTAYGQSIFEGFEQGIEHFTTGQAPGVPAAPSSSTDSLLNAMQQNCYQKQGATDTYNILRNESCSNIVRSALIARACPSVCRYFRNGTKPTNPGCTTNLSPEQHNNVVSALPPTINLSTAEQKDAVYNSFILSASNVCYRLPK